MDSDTYACPVCGQPVESVVRRHKTLGAWVPTWVPGPCRNPKCGEGPEQDARGADPEARPRTAEPSPETVTDHP
ncbi:hypothetical protein [Streptomyces sp. AC512_CC834]|uniref:hypothetical protein n=1 Tax=Streptomyces sp. AC512_CC834 TaxID=2823691 RepID=UPI001C26FA9C|nr:hypothetical protein [Streptomyces sp. AC512_CC834]